MPYESIDDLPDGVRHHLPEHAQAIYLAAFNHAWEEYRERDNREEIARRVAWAAVKRRYHKVNGDWVER